jgi:hypothetical protein
MRVSKLLVVISILLLSNSFYAQKGSWGIGIATGIRGEICYNFYKRDGYFQSGNQISTPPIEFKFIYGLNNNFYIESGISYINNKTNYCIYWGAGKDAKQYWLYSSLQIPIALMYDFPLGKSKFSLFTKTGIAFSIPLQKRNTNSYDPPIYSRTHEYTETIDDTREVVISETTNYYTQIVAPYNNINLLINTGLGFAYKFNCGLSVSMCGEFYYGTRRMAWVTVDVKGEQYVDSRLNARLIDAERISFRGDYWNVGFGVFYIFKHY